MTLIETVGGMTLPGWNIFVNISVKNSDNNLSSKRGKK